MKLANCYFDELFLAGCIQLELTLKGLIIKFYFSGLPIYMQDTDKKIEIFI